MLPKATSYATIPSLLSFLLNRTISVTSQTLINFVSHNPVLCMAFVILTCAIIVTETTRLFRGYSAVNPAQLVPVINTEHARVIDLSSAKEFLEGHVAGSMHIDASMLQPTHRLLANAQDNPVVLICRNGQTSSVAARRLVKAGFKKVYWLEGGVSAWQMAELPLLKGRAGSGGRTSS